MAGVRRALIVATDDYSDPKLTRLNAPAEDARVLADVLRDDAVGCFEVETVVNQRCHDVRLAIASFFGAGKYGDTLLVHFSSHGVKSPGGELYFATTDTDLSDEFKLKVTAIPSALVREAMEESRAGLILCFVDCCYSGAFVKLAKAADTDDLTERLGGKGRAVITASTSLQLALDGDEDPSLFTRAVIDGLQSGEADRDLDGLVSLDELYSFVHEQVTSRNPNQTPVKSFDVQGEVYVARRSTPVSRPAPLDPGLLADARSLVPYKRMGAISGLASILEEGHPGRSFAAREELTRMAQKDDSTDVRGEAQRVLDAAGEPAAPAIPEYEPVVPTRGGSVSVPDTGTERTGGEADHPEPDDVSGGAGDRRWWQPAGFKRAGSIALGLVAVLLIGGYAWHSLGNDSGGPALSDTEFLTYNGSGIVALDSSQQDPVPRKIVDDPKTGFPTISEDRRWMVYLSFQGRFGVPRLARVDGTDDAPLLGTEASKTCPYTTRPAFDPDDGSLLAVICQDQNGNYTRLVIVNRDGNLVDPSLWADPSIQGAPTWTGDGRIVFARGPEPDKTTLWAIAADGSQTTPTRITLGQHGSDYFPDWSPRGLLFLRTEDKVAKVLYLKNVDDPTVTPIHQGTDLSAPTWAPGGDAAAWLENAPHGRGTLWREAVPGDGSPTQVTTDAWSFPAWGSR